MRDDSDPGVELLVAPHHGKRIVVRRVVDQDQLEVVEPLRKDRGDVLLEIPTVVVVGDGHRKSWRCHEVDGAFGRPRPSPSGAMTDGEATRSSQHSRQYA